MTDWKPIETAPRDRKRVLLGHKDGSMMVGFWNGSAWDDGDFMSFEDWPTHWMPLPEPPMDKP
jgi:hypothetical protein